MWTVIVSQSVDNAARVTPPNSAAHDAAHQPGDPPAVLGI
jgi:hypothetical protein